MFLSHAVLIVPPERQGEEGFHDWADFRGNVADGAGRQWPKQEASCIQVVECQFRRHAVNILETPVFELDCFAADDGQREQSVGNGGVCRLLGERGIGELCEMDNLEIVGSRHIDTFGDAARNAIEFDIP